MDPDRQADIAALDSTLTTYRFDADTGGLEPRQTIPTLPPAWSGRNTTSEIAVAPSGRFVYASNRGHDSVAIFAVEPATGTLRPPQAERTRGSTKKAPKSAENRRGDVIAVRKLPGSV